MEDLGSFRVIELKAKCRELGLSVSGKKADLISRITTRHGPNSSGEQALKSCVQVSANRPHAPAVLTAESTIPTTSGIRNHGTAFPPSHDECGFIATRSETPSSTVHETSKTAVHKRRRVAETQPLGRVITRKAISSQPLVVQSEMAGSIRAEDIEPAVGSGPRPGVGLQVTLHSTFAAGNTTTASAEQKANPMTSLDPIKRRRGLLKLRNGPRVDNIGLEEKSSLAGSLLGRPPCLSDADVPVARLISSPPRIKDRRSVEKFARIFALVAFHSAAPISRINAPKIGLSYSHSWVFPTEYSASQFLVHLLPMSRNFRYASILAFTSLTFLKFAGRRTDLYVRSKAWDLQVCDLRPWYFHRLAEVSTLVEAMGRWWGERAWKYMLNLDSSANSHGLHFSGISSHLLGNPDHRAQWDVAIRFWIQRFFCYASRMRSGYRQLLRDLQAQTITRCEPLLTPESSETGSDAFLSSEIWSLGTRDGRVFFVLGLTGEVLGWEASQMDHGWTSTPILHDTGYTTLSVAQQELAIKSRGHSSIYQTTNTETSHPKQRHRTVNEDIAWRNLRGDWQAYVSNLLSPKSAVQPNLKPLIQHVFHPSLSKTHPHGININIVLPHHYALAERFILTHVYAGGVSGPQLLPSIATRKPRITLDLEQKWTVESVRCSGEKYRSSMASVLAPGVGFVQTPETGWFVLEETGQEIAMEEYGIQGMWATILGVKEDGSVLPTEDIEALRSCFVRD